MSKELSKELMVISMRNGVEIPVEAERVTHILPLLEKRGFVRVEGRIINSVDIIGIFKSIDLEETTRRKNGQWKCGEGSWHNKGDTCSFKLPEYAKEWIK